MKIITVNTDFHGILSVSLAALGLACASSLLSAQPVPQSVPRQAPATDSTPRLRVGGFVDSYYAWDAGRPPTRDRSFAGGTLFGTQPGRHNEFNVNLAYLDLTVDAPSHRGRVALQAGTSVQANYAAEPVVGQVSGPSVQQFIQEAFAGIRLGRRAWVDAGIFFSNLGMEGWVSRDNLTYTRSLVADYSPYYSAGARLVYDATPTLTARVDLVNGWQTISEADDGKGLGIRLDWKPVAGRTVSYFSFTNAEGGGTVRHFHGIGASLARGPLTLLAEADGGILRATSTSSRWYGLLGVVRTELSPTVVIVGRLERYHDPDRAALATGSIPGRGRAPDRINPGFRGSGASVGVDVRTTPGALWRTEVRGFTARDPLFPNGATGASRRTGGFLVTSLSVGF